MSETRFLSPGMKLAITLSLGLVAMAFILVVIPGFAIYQAGDFLFGRYFGVIHGDNLLPIAMLTQLLWAPAIPALYALVRKVARRLSANNPSTFSMPLRLGATLGFVGGLYAWAVILALFFHSQFGRLPGV